jgi:hypothetical protein
VHRRSVITDRELIVEINTRPAALLNGWFHSPTRRERVQRSASNGELIAEFEAAGQRFCYISLK